MSAWYARPVVVVSDMERALTFYERDLGFGRDWGFDQNGRPKVVQVSRAGCEIILCAHWPERVGKSLLFLSLDPPVLDALREELTGRGVAVKDGWWGYRLMVVEDPDGNTLYFNYPNDDGAAG